MECAYCGRKKGMWETFTRYGFCPDCNAEVRDRIMRGLELIRSVCTLCDQRMKLNQCPITDSELLWRIEDALETVGDLEDLRAIVPFFKSSTIEYHDTLTLCKRALASGHGPVVIRPGLSQVERERANFLKSLDSLDREPIPTIPVSQSSVRRKPDPIRAILCSRIARTARPESFGNYVALDLKTTGINLRRDEIIEVSAIRFRDFQPVRQFYSLVLPLKPIPSAIERLGGVTNELVRGAPLIREVLPVLQTFIGQDHLVGYHLLNDLSFLYAFGLEPISEGRRYFDTIEIAQSFLTTPMRHRGSSEDIPPYDVENYRLDTLCLRYTIHFENDYHPGCECLSNGMLFAGLVRERTTPPVEVPEPPILEAAATSAAKPDDDQSN